MQVAVDKLTRKIKQHGLNIEDVANRLDIDQSTFYRKLAREGKTFTVDQAQQLAEILEMSSTEATEIFFAN